MSDLIEREQAIQEIYRKVSEEESNAIPGEDMDVGVITGLKMAVRIIKEQPSARLKGKWVRKSETAWSWTCSCCGKDDAYAYSASDSFEPTVLQDFFCPNCGAEMEAE